ncbi:MAG: CHAP domain-containing protein, partial [Nocardioides sp.]
MACALLLLLPAAAGADAGNGAGHGKPGHGKPGKPGQEKPGDASGKATPDEKKPKPEPMIGAPGTHEAHDTYGYPWPEAPDCNESTVVGGCINDGLGFFQGQCTSWVAFRLGQRNGLGFSNWYTGRHWGNASEWAKVARKMGRKPDKIPAVGAVAWFKRGHVAYVEQVNSDGSIVISEMNFDGHNAFRLVTVSPGYGWPDRFIHLADVAPTDVTPPTAPSGLTADRNVGGIQLQWEPSSDDLGVTGYRISRDGVPLTSATTTSVWDERVSPGQAYSYSVTAVDAAGNESTPTTLSVSGQDTSVDRTWLTTAAGPAWCGRTGSEEKPRIGCRVQTRRGWRYADLNGTAQWGRDGTRSFVPTSEGGLAFCRRVGRDPGHARCTELDVEKLAWRRDQSSRRVDLPPVADSSWVSTSAGPALCGRAGTQARQRVGCTVLTDAGWRSTKSDREVAWGHDGTRAFVTNSYGGVTWCREVGRPARPGLACAPLVADTLTWGYDRISTLDSPVQLVNRAWLETGAGPALCGRTGSLSNQRVGCTVLTEGGWTHRATEARWGRPLSRALLGSGEDVSWCRIVDAGAARAACSELDADSLRW